ncbi:MAG: IPTL-CTERM sorting domain-containing protein [Burkholderiales bacterium]|nr:IPTL-CTERM sorting domain-containing protein [Burkholderiales bacterium]GIK87309.1 MAG: hypothetical protein BroJett026_27900 [Betaproteobacteria bacterium]
MRRAVLSTLIALAVLAAPAANGAIVINFPDFSNCATLQLNANAACTANVLRVTPALGGQSGSAFSQTLIPLGAGNSFSTYFAFRITDNSGNDGDGPGADGITFTVQPNASTAGGAGGGIGYLGIPNSVAVEFDTWDNGIGAGDPNGNHVGVDLNGSVASVVTVPIATRLNDGNVWYAWIDYNGSVLELRLSQVNTRPVAPTLSHAVNLATVLGTTQAFVGFTSGTGAAWANHDVLTWTFDNSFAPIGAAPAAAIPTLSHVALAALALLLVAFGARGLRRR